MQSQKMLNLIDIGFNDYTVEDKREAFMILDIAMKKLHEEGKMVTSFDPKNIYFQDGIYFYKYTADISPVLVDSKDAAVLHNVIGLSNLAFCTYLPNYDLKNGLMNPSVIRSNYRQYESVFSPEDKEYYRSVLVDSFENGNLPKIPYYYDYIANNLKDSDLSDRSNSSIRSYVKATEAGKMMTEQNAESAFSTTFYLVCMVSAALIAFVGLGIYFLN